jgi:hypothetical protein
MGTGMNSSNQPMNLPKAGAKQWPIFVRSLEDKGIVIRDDFRCPPKMIITIVPTLKDPLALARMKLPDVYSKGTYSRPFLFEECLCKHEVLLVFWR